MSRGLGSPRDGGHPAVGKSKHLRWRVTAPQPGGALSSSQASGSSLFCFRCAGSSLQRVGLVAPWYMGSQFTDWGSNLHPLHWKADS